MYFGREERQEILDALVKEVQEDLQPDTLEGTKFVKKAVGSLVGRAYGQWMRGEL